MRVVAILPLLLSAVLAFFIVDDGIGMLRPVFVVRKKGARPPGHMTGHRSKTFELHNVVARQAGICEDASQFECLEFLGCCDAGTVCGMFGGQPGCCPQGQECAYVAEDCEDGEEMCGTGCCPSGTRCTTKSDGSKDCVAANGPAPTSTSKPRGDIQCPNASFEKCEEFEGCCPKGTACLAGGLCDIKCTPSDPKCGNGCCLKGYECNDDTETCIQIATDLVSSTTTDFFNTRRTATATKTDSDKETTTETGDATKETKKSDASSMHFDGLDSFDWKQGVEAVLSILLFGVMVL